MVESVLNTMCYITDERQFHYIHNLTVVLLGANDDTLGLLLLDQTGYLEILHSTSVIWQYA